MPPSGCLTCQETLQKTSRTMLADSPVGARLSGCPGAAALHA